jgi:hypothetical protein
MLNVFLLDILMLSVVMLSVLMLSVFMLSVECNVSLPYSKCSCAGCRYADCHGNDYITLQNSKILLKKYL